ISPTRYYKDDSCWSADLKSKATEDIISIGSFMEVLVLNHYVLVRKILRREERSLNNNSFLGEYECSSLALDRDERRDEKKRLDHLKQDQTMDYKMVVKEIVSRLLEEEEKLEWWFEKDIDKEEERFEGDEDGGEVRELGD
ncbi:hypothetical protein Tco_0554130, partial [Tanacetum coccineum]